MRRLLITLWATLVIAAGVTGLASARGGFGGHGGMGHGGFGGMHGGFARMGGFGHAGFARHGAFARPIAFHSSRFVVGRPMAFRHRSAFRHHRFFRNRFAFIGLGAAYPYGYYNSCYAPVWTRWGWRWRYVCYTPFTS